MTKSGRGILTLIARAILGMAMIYGFNYVLAQEHIDIQVGYNFISLLTCAILGTPGVGLLYGVSLYKIL